MQEDIEVCWLRDERQEAREKAPLLCRQCKRFKTMKFMHKPESIEKQLFLNGFRLVIYQIAIQLDQYAPLSEDQKGYIQCLEIQTKCSLDRGVPIETLEETINNIGKQAEYFKLKGN